MFWGENKPSGALGVGRRGDRRGQTDCLEEGDLRAKNTRLLLPGCFQPGEWGRDEDCSVQDSQKEQLLGDPLQKS